MHKSLFTLLWLVGILTAACEGFPEDRYHDLWEPALEQPGVQYTITTDHSTVSECLASNLPYTTTIVLPGEAHYREAANSWPAWELLNSYPSAIVFVDSVEDIAKTVLCAAKYEVAACARSGKHGAMNESGCGKGGIIVNLENMDHVVVDTETKTARYETGVTLGMLYDALYETSGLLTSAGSVSSVGIGQVLGCGRGPLNQKYGLACDVILQVEYIDWTGTWKVANSELDPDALWAARGGAGIFPGIVTHITVKGYDVPAETTEFTFTYPREAFADVAEVFLEHQAAIDRNCWAEFSMWGGGPDTLPFLLDARIHGLFFGGSRADVLAELAPITAELSNRGWDYTLDATEDLTWKDTVLRNSLTDSLQDRTQGPWTGPNSEAMHPASFMGYKRFSKSDAQQIEGFLNDPILQASPAQSVYFTLYTMAGATMEVAANATAFPHRSVPYLIAMVHSWPFDDPNSAMYETILEAHRGLMVNTIEDFMVTDANRAAGRTTGSFFNYRDNFMPGAPKPQDQLRAYFGDNLERLTDICCERDPQRVFVVEALPLECDAPAHQCRM